MRPASARRTDDLSKEPRLLNADLGLSANNPKNPTHTRLDDIHGAVRRPRRLLDRWTSYSLRVRHGVVVGRAARRREGRRRLRSPSSGPSTSTPTTTRGSRTMKGEGQRISRRRFLSTVGVGAGAVALNPGSVVAAPERAHGHGQSFLRPENFGRIFRLRPFAEQSPKVEAALRELGKPGGLLDAADQLAAGPKALIVDPALSANNPNNPDHTAGTTFFGQFLDHDMTFDASSRLAPADRSRRPRQLPHAGARPRLGLRRRPGRRSRSCTTRSTTSSSRSRAAGSSRTCRVARTAPRSSATRATTRT